MERERQFMRPTEEVEARLAYVKTALKITPAQQQAWDAYANLQRDNARDMEARFNAMRSEPRKPDDRPRDAVSRLEREQTFLTEAAARIAKLIEVEKPLYASFSPDQKRVADMVLNPRHPREHEHMRMGHMGGWKRQA
jgi:hypothetical protein